MSRIHLHATKDLNCSYVNCCIEFNVYLHKNDFMNNVKTFSRRNDLRANDSLNCNNLHSCFYEPFTLILFNSQNGFTPENPSAMFHDRGP